MHSRVIYVVSQARSSHITQTVFIAHIKERRIKKDNESFSPSLNANTDKDARQKNTPN